MKTKDRQQRPLGRRVRAQPAKLKMRLHSWLNTVTLKAEFGVDVLVGKTWHHLAENGVACIYKTKERAERKMCELQVAAYRLS